MAWYVPSFLFFIFLAVSRPTQHHFILLFAATHVVDASYFPPFKTNSVTWTRSARSSQLRSDVDHDLHHPDAKAPVDTEAVFSMVINDSKPSPHTRSIWARRGGCPSRERHQKLGQEGRRWRFMSCSPFGDVVRGYAEENRVSSRSCSS